MTTLPEPVALQFWSHQEITPEIRAQIETILSGHGEQLPECKNVDPLPAQAFQEGGDAACRSVSAMECSDVQCAQDTQKPKCSTASSAAPTSEPERATENPNIKQTKEGIWVLVNDSHISRWVEEHGTLFHDRQTLPLVLPEIPVGGTVIDVGAFIGDTTAPFLERVGPTGKVLAFEPNRDAWECLKRNCPRAICHPFALGSSISLLGLAKNENAGARHLQVADSDEEAINIGTLDALGLAECDFIKIDVEGYELRVLRGAERTINRFHSKMLIEVNRGALERQGTSPEELFVWLDGRGYSHDIVQDDASFDDQQFDILCRHVAVSPAKQNSLAEIRSLAERLQKFCGTSAQTRLVRLELHKQGVIELPYRFRKRGKWRKRKAKA